MDQSKIVYRLISELNPSEYNPRKLSDKNEEDLKESINRFGFVQPVVVNINENRTDIIIGGHQKVKVAEKLGISEVPCIELDLDEDKERELNIRLNKNNGEFDFDLLEEYFEVDELVDWGFESFEFDMPEEVDYTVLDDEDLEEEIDDMEVNVRKAIQLDFEASDYEPARQLVSYFRKKNVYIGGLLIKLLEAEKKKIDDE